MVPVRLALRNFLSYGEDAPELDFEAFHVACLSGGNGQGKSALLEAMTWALWGQARKSGAGKEEIMRVGAREMEVVFTFDLEGERYRVLRRYAMTAGGTGKPTLEFQVLDGEDFRPLTTPGVRDTQALINERLGLDYDTFINSTFLLQGRSDEFTRKSATDRKRILGTILGLGRYERLEERAKVRQTSAKERALRLGQTEERLKMDLEHEGAWKEERAEAEAEVARLAEARTVLGGEQAALADRLARVDAQARQSEALRATRDEASARLGRLDSEAAALAAQIAEAAALLARADKIEANHARYEALQAERSALDEKASLHLGLETQLHALRAELKDKQRELENRADALAHKETRLREKVAEAEARLAERPRLQSALEQARAAERERAALAQQRDTREGLLGRLAALDQHLAAEEGALTGKLAGLQEQLRPAPPDAGALDRAIAERARAAEALDALAGEMETVRDEGTALSARLAATEAESKGAEADVAAVEAKRARLRQTADGACPTCGTPLTPAHRAEVDAEYGHALTALAARLGEASALAAGLAAQRDVLRARYADLKQTLDGGQALRAELAGLRERRSRLDEDARQRARLEAERDETARALRDQAFAPHLRAQRTEVAEAADALAFDPARLDALTREASAGPRHRDDLARLDVLAEEHGAHVTQAAHLAREAAALRDDLARGLTARPLRERLGAAEARLAGLGYDGPRHDAVRVQLQAVADAPATLGRLLDARRHLVGWTARREALAEERAGLAARRDQASAALDVLAGALAERPALDAEAQALASRRAELDGRYSQAQQRLGGLAERLERCARDRETLARTRVDLREARREQTLYTKLRTAFGRSGIPALIIEETVPEIEARANEILERLSSGRTRVALETLRDKKTGGTRETLDIRITDDTGQPRPYELFSGGEAFRVNFALRIALSQMLAARAGTRIRTLVVDEGFGTQDREGLAHLVGAIRAIQDDFDKILVITHLDELKDAFPVRIEVSKRAVEGSTFDVVGV